MAYGFARSIRSLWLYLHRSKVWFPLAVVVISTWPLVTSAEISLPSNTPSPLQLIPSAHRHALFGTDGEVLADLGVGTVNVGGMALTPEGDLIVAGTLGNDIFVTKYLPDGSVDLGFGTAGVVITNQLAPYEVNAVAVLPNGGVLVAGSYNINTTPTSILHSYKADGTALTSYAVSAVSAFTDIAIQGANDIFLSGFNSGGTQDYLVFQNYVFQGDATLLKLNLTVNGQGQWDGWSPDENFGALGLVTFSRSPALEARAVAVQSNGNIILAGNTSATDSSSEWFLTSFDAQGDPDASFNNGNGGFLIGIGDQEKLYDLTLIDDRILLTGSYKTNFGSGLQSVGALLKRQSNGSPDTSFGIFGTGSRYFPANAAAGWSFDVELHSTVSLPNGQLMVAGRRDDQAFIMRIEANGAMDTAFGIKDITVPDFFHPRIDGKPFVPYASVMNPLGQYYVAGTVDPGDGQFDLGLLSLASEVALSVSTGPTRPSTLAPASLVQATLPAEPFVSPTSDPISYTVALNSSDPLPDWLSFDADTRSLSGTPAVADTGVYRIHISASDGAVTRTNYFDLKVRADFMEALFNHTPKRWNFGSPEGTPVTITYHFRASDPTDDAAYTANWVALNADEKNEVKAALSRYSRVANITFTEVEEDPNSPGPVGDIRFGLVNTTDDWTVRAEPPRPDGGHSSVWFKQSIFRDSNGDNLTIHSGSEAHFLMVQGIAQALGLNPTGTSAQKADGLPVVEDYGLVDSQRFSVLSGTEITDRIGPNGAAVFPRTPMLWDVPALQFLYGKNPTALNTIWTFWENSSFFQSVWDGEGGDSIRLTGTLFFGAAEVKANSIVNLIPGSLSSIRLGNRPASASEYWGNENLVLTYDSQLDDVIGGWGNDTLIGNDRANDLDGNRGDDWIFGGLGADELEGGLGQDIFVFRLGDSPYGVSSQDTLMQFNREDQIELIASWAYDNRAETDDHYNITYSRTPLVAMPSGHGLTVNDIGYVSAGASSLAEFVNQAAASANVGEMAVWSDGTDGYVFISSGDPANTVASTDLVFKVTGLKPEVAKLIIGEGDQAGRAIFKSTLPDEIFADRFQ